MDNTLINKKKIRGWKRKIKKIEQWKENTLNLDIENLNKYQRDYVKLWIDPFYRLTRRNPPTWYCRLLLKAMFEVYFNWNSEIKGINKDYYLKLWIYEPNFINSQIVVAVNDCLHFYDNPFIVSEIQKPFPLQKYKELSNIIDQFEWELCYETQDYIESHLVQDYNDGLYSENKIINIRSKAFLVDSITYPEGKKDAVYFVKKGYVWIGKFKDI
ncbi:hypothetical protein HQN90_15785 [Paenibacillus alba]|uniref:hypothetical protein n=1 Tax=Paenibacillus alba TaxID=1197127 RepID=UPI001565FCE7|nr:hypothetical protein [Paenibacillus alba]NQX67583.1 hypothetical protein [Paenibacillus alba]